MAINFAQFGNDLYTGKRSIDFVGRWRTFFAIAAVTMLVSVLLLGFKQLNPGIEFRGGSEFRISGVSTTDLSPAEDVVGEAVPAGEEPRISVIGTDTIRVQTQQLSEEDTTALRADLAEAYDVAPNAVTSSFVGASWGSDVTRQALLGLGIFLALASLVMAVYFRAWQMALAAMVALIHDLLLTAGIYALIGFEVTPAAVIGFLTILGYSLYDTVVVFDKVRENTAHVLSGTRRTYSEAANLAVNQTLVRSINTTVVALLPVSAILFIGAFLLGAGTLKDISLALFVGMLAGAYSSVFIAPALLVVLRRREQPVREQEARVAKARAAAARAAGGEHVGDQTDSATPVTVGVVESSPTGGSVAPSRGGATATTQVGPRNQPKRGTRNRPSGKKR